MAGFVYRNPKAVYAYVAMAMFDIAHSDWCGNIELSVGMKR